MKTDLILWGGLWYSKNKKDGISQGLLCDGLRPELYRTRREAREWIQKRFGYIKNRQDLRGEPHGWRLPRAVKVKVTYEYEVK